MRQGSVTEGVDVSFDVLDVDADCLGSFLEKVRIMNSLGTGQNLLTTDEKVVTIGEFRVLQVSAQTHHG